MNILSRLIGPAQRSIADPVFGPLRRRKGSWTGVVDWRFGNRRLPISVCRVSEEPNEADHEAYRNLVENYPKLLPAIRLALFRLWRTASREPDAVGPRPSSPEELFDMLQMDGLFIKPTDRVELLFGFAGDAWPDAMFTVAVRDESVEPIALDD
jgi:hypothetical protein